MSKLIIGETKVKATGMGEFFVGMQGGSGQGTLLHIGGQDVVSQEVEDAPHCSGEHLEEGIMYKDEGNGTILWLAEDDFEVIQ